jgi:hypothetical protein
MDDVAQEIHRHRWFIRAIGWPLIAGLPIYGLWTELRAGRPLILIGLAVVLFHAWRTSRRSARA